MDSAFHFAAEEFVMTKLRPTEPVLMLWRTERTIMIGANQIAEIEADIEYARTNGVAVVRRSSGGGTIYTDPGTLLYTIILPAGGAGATSGEDATRAITVPSEAVDGSAANISNSNGNSCNHRIGAVANRAADSEAAETATNGTSMADTGATIIGENDTNIFTTMIDPKSVVKDYLAAPVISALKEMGVHASLEGRNDILVGGKKISGIAQYIKYGYICSHGSLLFNADLAELARVLTADDEKIKSKALRSIRSRVTNIAEHLPGKDDTAKIFAEYDGGSAHGGTAHSNGNSSTECKRNFTKTPVSDGATGTEIHNFIVVLRESWNRIFGTSEYVFSKDDITEIEKTRVAKYAGDEWTFGHTPEYSFHNSKRFPGGAVEIFADIKNGSIKQIKIAGDFLALRPVSDIEAKLTGVMFERNALAAALTEADVARTLGSVTLEEFLSVLE